MDQHLDEYSQQLEPPCTNPCCHGCDYCHGPSAYPELDDDGYPIMNFIMPYASIPVNNDCTQQTIGDLHANEYLDKVAFESPMSEAASSLRANPNNTTTRVAPGRLITPTNSQLLAIDPRLLAASPSTTTASGRPIIPARPRLPVIDPRLLAALPPAPPPTSTFAPLPPAPSPALPSAFPFPCGICSRNFESHSQWRRHRYSAHGELTDRGVKRKQSLSQLREGGSSRGPAQQQQQRYTCAKCGDKPFRTAYTLQAHVRDLHDARSQYERSKQKADTPCAVPGCGHVASSPHMLKDHMSREHRDFGRAGGGQRQ